MSYGGVWQVSLPVIQVAVTNEIRHRLSSPHSCVITHIHVHRIDEVTGLRIRLYAYWSTFAVQKYWHSTV